MISFTGVYKNFSPTLSPGGCVLENVNLKIKKGEFVYVIGDSGAGKTTLLKMLYGEERPSRGMVEVFGKDLARASVDDLQSLRRRIGVIFQDFRLIDDLSALDNVRLSLEIAENTVASGVRRDPDRACAEVLHSVGMTHVARKLVRTLSGGEKQRIAAARALVRQPEIIIADEPTGALDRDHTWSLMDLLQKFHLRGTTVLVATHDREIVRRVRRRSCNLKSGKLVVEDGVCIF